MSRVLTPQTVLSLMEQRRRLARRVAAYDRLVTAAIDPEAAFQSVADVRAFLQAGLPECRQ